MRILHVINTLKMGGAEKLVSEIVPLMIKDGLDVEVVVFVSDETPLLKSLIENKVKVHIFKKVGSVYNPLYIFKLRQLISNFDIIHTHNTSPQIFGILANLGKQKKICTTEHGGSNRRRTYKLFSILDKLMYREYDRIICISDKAEESLRKFIHSNSNKIKTIYNGIDVSKFINSTPLDDIRQRFHADTKIICMVAGFRWEKDQDTIIRGMVYLPQNFVLLLVGIGSRKIECESLAQSLGISDRVVFLGLRNDIPSILKTSDYIVMSSHFEGLSLSSLEGMASGKPFLASDVDGLREVVDGAGLLFPHGDAKSFANMICQIESTPGLYNKLCISGQERAKLYDISRMVLKYEEEYLSLSTKNI